MTVDTGEGSTLYSRQTEILDPERAARSTVAVLGVGTVGSNAAMQLAKAGFGKLIIHDLDTVEDHNLPSQDYTMSDVGKFKVDALASRLKEVSPHVDVVTGGQLHGGEHFPADFVVMAVDSMDMRKRLFDLSIRLRTNIKLMLDFRMNANNLQYWAVRPMEQEDLDRYEDTLYSDADVVSAPCGGRTFAPVGAISGGLATQLISKALMGHRVPYYSMLDLDAFTLTTTTDHVS